MDSLSLLGIQESQLIEFDQRQKRFYFIFFYFILSYFCAVCPLLFRQKTEIVEVKSPYHMVDWESPHLPVYKSDSWSQCMFYISLSLNRYYYDHYLLKNSISLPLIIITDYVSKDALILARDTFNTILQMRGLVTKGTITQKNVLFVSRKSGLFAWCYWWLSLSNIYIFLGEYSIRDIKNEPELRGLKKKKNPNRQ